MVVLGLRGDYVGSGGPGVTPTGSLIREKERERERERERESEGEV
jgi:hypothetical protein